MGGNYDMSVSGALVNGISVLVRRSERASSLSFHHVRIQKGSHLQLAVSTVPQPTMTSSFQNCEKETFVFQATWLMAIC